MANLKMSVPHELEQDEALKRVKKLIGQFSDQFAGNISDLKEEWKDNTDSFSFQADGYHVTGQLTVKASKIEVTGEVPYPASLFMGVIEAVIIEKAKVLLKKD